MLIMPQIASFYYCAYLVIKLVFAALYLLGPNSVVEMSPGSFSDAFFFSVETLATVGYGHMYPLSFYGHVITTLEIMAGVFWVGGINWVVSVPVFFFPA